MRFYPFSFARLIGWLVLSLAGTVLLARGGERLELGRLPTGVSISFERGTNGEWGLSIAGTSIPTFSQSKPARIEVYLRENDIRPLVAGYRTVEKSTTGGEFDARADVAYG